MNPDSYHYLLPVCLVVTYEDFSNHWKHDRHIFEIIQSKHPSHLLILTAFKTRKSPDLFIPRFTNVSNGSNPSLYLPRNNHRFFIAFMTTWAQLLPTGLFDISCNILASQIFYVFLSNNCAVTMWCTQSILSSWTQLASECWLHLRPLIWLVSRPEVAGFLI